MYVQHDNNLATSIRVLSGTPVVDRRVELSIVDGPDYNIPPFMTPATCNLGPYSRTSCDIS